ncbi:PDDEXK nuclease domain-containing protein [Bacteroides cutis]|jgi:predicted nuclease of restriction endonuclease-like (RecB) superfamily|uniref:PDDEXK nuclease domain-containing protein n=1 Tax=Bacteroides cutis TaxID=2024197 RepID=UPI0023A85EB0|nr:PDDEXK nuclease domain-containing protein [Bacteroides cutis]
MSKGLTIIDKDYTQWVEDLSVRYRQSQTKAAVRVNRELLKYYWELGRDIEEMHVEERWGQSVIKNLSVDLQLKNPNSTGLSRTNIYYAKKFYLLYSQYLKVVPQAVGQLEDGNAPQVTEDSSEVVPQVVGQLEEMLFSIPWGHHRYLIDRYGTEPEKAFFYVKKTMKEGWSRDVLLNFMDSGLYEREGKALTNFTRTLPDEASDLAQELTKDPYNFAFTGITKPYNEQILKDALLANISQFLLELGTGFAYVGKEYRLQIGQKEKFIDLLFYNINLSCYVVIEVKIGEFDFQDLGQLSGYVVACNHILKKEGRDNPTIGLLICRQKDSLLAQYALEGSNLPLGISEYELSKLYPEKVDGTIPTIEEIEAKLGNKDKS